jgi:hypothetical protein
LENKFKNLELKSANYKDLNREMERVFDLKLREVIDQMLKD